ncbi:MAG TPA: GMC family oxidoreductase N-terminal domain-containing protein [Burkholderiaceae bacterium]
MDKQSFDYIVTGAGSAGCVVAHRLVKAGHSVLLLEAGPTDAIKFVRIPATFVRVIGTERSWVYETTPQPHASGRKMFVPQGRMTGGGSSLNAMIYIRGAAADYDGWAAAGCTGWGWQDVLPAFRRAESNTRFSGAMHGTDGPLRVSDTKFRHPLSLAFLKGAQEAGLAYNDDFNGGSQAGVGFYQTTTIDGTRGSTATTYLAAVRGDPKLSLINGAHVLRVRLEAGVASGVEYRTADGSVHAAQARREVVLCAGALATPKLLQVSGIGPGALLQQLGIPLQHDLPGVGENFQDHLEIIAHGRCREPISLLGQDKGLTALKHGLQWELFKTGLLTSNVVESGGFVDTLGTGRPDVQFHVLPVLVGDVDRPMPEVHGISIDPCFLRPKSRGRVRAKSADALQPAEFDGGYLSAQEDVDTLVRGLKLARRILRTPSMRAVIAEELYPGEQEHIADAELEQFVRRYAKTVYHPVGTCRMGSDPQAVVDPQLRVHGIGRLRVCDASVMPTICSGNTNAPTIMIAERGAEFMLAH